MTKNKEENWFKQNSILSIFLGIIALFILIGIFSSGDNNAKQDYKAGTSNSYQEEPQPQNKEINLREALSLCYKKAEDCTERETISEIEAKYYESALKESCLQVYSAYSQVDDSESIMKFTENLC